MFQFDTSTQFKMEEILKKNCPSPENNLIRLGEIAGYMPRTKKSAMIRRFILDIDEIISEVRWHLGQALFLMKTQPHVLNISNDEDEFSKNGLLTSVQLLLRGFLRQPDRIFYEKLDESRRGGTVGGWIFHMMIDSSIYRSIAILDRIAHVLWYAAELPAEKIYFRSRKIEKINKSLKLPESQKLVEIANSKILNSLIDYRDSLTHNMKAYSRISGSLPIDDWISNNGKQVYKENEGIDVDLMFALGNAAYHQVLEVMKYFLPICEKKWPIPPKTVDTHG